MTELSVFDSEYMMPAYVGAMSMNEEQWPDAGSKKNEGESNMFMNFWIKSSGAGPQQKWQFFVYFF